MTSKVNGVPGADGRGHGEDRNSPATQYAEGRSSTIRGEEMTSGQDPAAPQIPQRFPEEGGRGEVRPHRPPDSADGARTKHGALARREYGLLAPEEAAGNPASADPQGSGDHRWEVPGNYPVFTVVMVIYHYIERIWRILVTPYSLYNIYNQ